MDRLLSSHRNMEQCRAARTKELRCRYSRIPLTEKQGGFKSLVSKFEKLSSLSKKINAEGGIHRELDGTGKQKDRSWRGEVGFEKNEKGLQKKRGRSTHDNDHGEMERTAKADGKRMKLCEESEDEKSVKSEDILIMRGKKEGRKGLGGFGTKLEDKGAKTPKSAGRDHKRIKLCGRSEDENSEKSEDIPVVRGKKEGRKWLGGFGTKLDDKGTEIPQSAGGDHKPKIGPPSEVRRESMVQMRIRMLEEAERSKQPRPVLNPKKITFDRVGSNNNSSIITPEATDAGTSSGGTTGTERTGLPKTSQLSAEHAKSLGLERAPAVGIHPAVSSTTHSESIPNVLTKVSQQHPAEEKPEVSSERKPKSTREWGPGHPSETQTFSSAARPEREVPPRRVAPTIRDRIHMFEPAKDNKEKGLVALFGVGGPAALGRRTNEKGQESEKERSRVVDEQQAEVEEPRPQIDIPKHKQISLGEYMAERKWSRDSTKKSSDGKAVGKYISAFAGWRRAREGSNASSETNNTAARDLKEIASKDKPVIPARRTSACFPTTAAPGYIGPRATQQSRCSSAQQSSGAHSEPLSDESFGAFQDPLSPLTAEIIPGNLYHRVAEIMDNPSEDKQRIIPQGGTDGSSDIERVGRANGLALTLDESSEDEAGEKTHESSEDEAGEDTPSIVQSAVSLRQPKPMRMEEVNRMMKFCRFGRGRSEERKREEREE